MTREQQINEAAVRYCLMGGIGDLFDTMAGFKEGAEWADQHPQWIPVEEAPFPPKKNKWDKKIEVLVYGLWMGRPTILFGTYHYDTNEWGANGLISDITHWMLLPEAPRKEDKNDNNHQ